jgi:hypothetical protein
MTTTVPITTEHTTHYMNHAQFPEWKDTYIDPAQPRIGYTVTYGSRVSVVTTSGETHEYHEWVFYPAPGSADAPHGAIHRYGIDMLGVLHIVHIAPGEDEQIVRSYSPNAWASVSHGTRPPYDLTDLVPNVA